MALASPAPSSQLSLSSATSHTSYSLLHKAPATCTFILGCRIRRSDNLLIASNGHRPRFGAGCINILSALAVDGSVNTIATDRVQLELNPVISDVQPDSKSEKSQAAVTEATTHQFMTDISNLIKLVDSRDIVEVELKHSNFEICIRKKEALPAASTPPTQLFAPPLSVYPGLSVQPAPAPTGIASREETQALPQLTPPASAPENPAANLPRILSPMAGTFYKSPAPAEPAFVKIGDKVQKGQVICIVEAMKLMNEIEADQTGTVVDILVEDGKPISIETPLFIVKP